MFKKWMFINHVDLTDFYNNTIIDLDSGKKWSTVWVCPQDLQHLESCILYTVSSVCAFNRCLIIILNYGSEYFCVSCLEKIILKDE